MSSERFPLLKAVFFDFGFTLWDERRAWATWAEYLGVQPLEFYAVLGSVIERGEHHHRAFEVFRPGIDVVQERRILGDSRQSLAFRPEELYADVLPCLKKLRSSGYRTGVAGNQFADSADTLRKMNAPLDFIGSSEEWGVEKPSLEFLPELCKLQVCFRRKSHTLAIAWTMTCCPQKLQEWSVSFCPAAHGDRFIP